MANKRAVSKPLKMWIDGRVFTIASHHSVGNSGRKSPKQTEDHVMDEHQLELMEIAKEINRYTAKIKLPRAYYSKIRKFQLARLDGAAIQLPQSEHYDAIHVHSENMSHVAKAVSHIHSTVGQIRLKSAPLQFACIPCIHPSIQKSFRELQRQILSMENEIHGMDQSIFMSPLKLHLTIDVYHWLDHSEEAEAVKALEEYKETLEEMLRRTGPLRLQIGTLDCMNSNVRKVNVLYANARFLEESQEASLQGVVDGIADHFYHRGLARKYQERVKLHMTVINTKYRKVGRQSIDATRIMEKFKDFQFGDCSFDTLHLSYMKTGADGFYKPLVVIRLNDNKNLEN